MGARPVKGKTHNVTLQEPSWQNAMAPWDLKQINLSENNYVKAALTHYHSLFAGQDTDCWVSL